MSYESKLKTCKRPRFRPEEFWVVDWQELFINNNYLKFFPTFEMTRIEQLNAITRFTLYFTILVLMFDINHKWLYLSVAIILIIVIIYYINLSDKSGNDKQLVKILDMRKKQKTDDTEKIKEQLKHDGEENFDIDIDTENEIKNYELETGFIDSNGDLFTGKKYKMQKYSDKNQESLFTVDEMEEFKRNTCKVPTKNNPFMNTNITDFNNGDKPVACNSYDEDIKEDIKVNFNHQLFRDVDEIWERVNSQRQFYTIPNTAVPNNQIEFAKWLYKIPYTCKENPAYGRCLRYENIKFNRSPNPY